MVNDAEFAARMRSRRSGVPVPAAPSWPDAFYNDLHRTLMTECMKAVPSYTITTAHWRELNVGLHAWAGVRVRVPERAEVVQTRAGVPTLALYWRTVVARGGPGLGQWASSRLDMEDCGYGTWSFRGPNGRWDLNSSATLVEKFEDTADRARSNVAQVQGAA